VLPAQSVGIDQAAGDVGKVFSGGYLAHLGPVELIVDEDECTAQIQFAAAEILLGNDAADVVEKRQGNAFFQCLRLDGEEWT